MARLYFSLLAVLATFGVIWCTNLPLGIPGEWTWQRTLLAGDFCWSVVPAATWIILLGSYVWYGTSRIEDAKKLSTLSHAAWLAGLAILSFLTLSGLREAAPPAYRSAKTAFVLYFPGPSGYFTEARKVRDTREFLTNYRQNLNHGDVLHQGTHPPGLIVGYRGLMWICKFVWLQNFLLETQPLDLRDAFQIISEQSRMSGGPLLTDHDRSVLWLAALLMQACAAATVIPLYALLRLHARRITSWQLVSFWPLVPAVTLFLPKSDACLPFLGCSVLALWLHGLRKQSLALCCAAGVVFWAGMTISLALLPTGCLAGLLTAWYYWGCSPPDRWTSPVKRLSAGLTAGVIGFSAPTGLLWLTTGCNLISVWIHNYHNHAGFYLQYPRTYWKWLLVNPIELGFAAGLPISVLALFGVVRAIRNPRDVAQGPAWACLATWSLLWLSGKNMGEAARLWIFLMPWVIWTSASAWDAAIDGVSYQIQRRRWLCCWACQVVATLLTVSRVVGFHL
ncbi:MAG: hypothetical protein JWM11_3822 [Planctomycetaceae bacterium]|nr:hypothetical protein [Planctomycetaceae bacterium]